jgi:hypothetical protein
VDKYSFVRWKAADGIWLSCRSDAGRVSAWLLSRLGPVPPPPRRHFSRHAEACADRRRRLPASRQLGNSVSSTSTSGS